MIPPRIALLIALFVLIVAWPRLPEPVKTGIEALAAACLVWALVAVVWFSRKYLSQEEGE